MPKQLSEDQIEEIRSIVASAGALVIFPRIMEVMGYHWDEDYASGDDTESDDEFQEGDDKTLSNEEIKTSVDDGFYQIE